MRFNEKLVCINSKGTRLIQGAKYKSACNSYFHNGIEVIKVIEIKTGSMKEKPFIANIDRFQIVTKTLDNI